MRKRLQFFSIKARAHVADLLGKVEEMRKGGDYSAEGLQKETQKLLEATKAAIQAEDFVSTGTKLAFERAQKAVAEKAWIDNDRYNQLARSMGPILAGMSIDELLAAYRSKMGTSEEKELLTQAIDLKLAGSSDDHKAEWEALQLEAKQQAPEAERQAYKAREEAQKDMQYLGYIKKYVEAVGVMAVEGNTDITDSVDAYHYQLMLDHWYKEKPAEQTAAG